MGKKRWYFPSKEADVIPWIKNFVKVLLANIARWGIAANLVTALGALGTAFEEAYTRRMLPDVGNMELACAVLPSPPKDIGELVRIVTCSKSPLALNFREEDRSKTVYMAARWKTTRQIEGPWSGIISAVIP
jgi:hypothetical protein